MTLLGDAIHAMSPARGSGANTALRDAALLAAELGAAAREEKTPVRAIADYERQMVDYGFAAVQASRRAELATSTRRGAMLRGSGSKTRSLGPFIARLVRSPV